MQHMWNFHAHMVCMLSIQWFKLSGGHSQCFTETSRCMLGSAGINVFLAIFSLLCGRHFGCHGKKVLFLEPTMYLLPY